MTYATLIVQAEADEDSKARIGLAAGLAGQFGALLIGVAARDLVAPVTAPLAGPIVVATLLAGQAEDIQQHLDAAEQQFRAVAGKQDQLVAWRSSIDNPAKAFTREGRAADLLVVGRQPESAGSRPSRHLDAGKVLMRAGRPVLIVPPGLSHLNAARIVVAWKDSREARRAVADALPLLKRATSVLVLEICDTPGDQEDAKAVVHDVADYLSRHGVAATAEVRLLREASDGRGEGGRRTRNQTHDPGDLLGRPRHGHDHRTRRCLWEDPLNWRLLLGRRMSVCQRHCRQWIGQELQIVLGIEAVRH